MKAKMTKKMILALDLGTQTGCSVWTHDWKLLRCETWDLSIRTRATKTIAADHLGERMLKLLERLYRLEEDEGAYPFLCAYEAITQGPRAGGRTAAVARWLEGVLLMWCAMRAIPCEAVSAGTIKKFATGHGGWKTTKEHMIKAATKQSGLEMNEHEADAFWLGKFIVNKIQTNGKT